MFYNLYQIDQTDPLFTAVEKCKRVEQGDIHHPEGDVFTHLVQTMQWAFRESNDIDLILAALLHDVGKQIDFRGHEQYAVKMLKGYISEKTEWLILNHMRLWYFILGDMKKLSKVKELADHKWLPDLVTLGRWDKLGRNPNKEIYYDRLDIMSRLRSI